MNEKCVVCNEVLSVDQFVWGDDDGRAGILDEVKDLCETHAKQILREIMNI